MMEAMEKINTGGPAFPGQPLGVDGLPVDAHESGMTLLDYFAGKALEGVLANNCDFETYKDCAEKAYGYAAAMIEEKERVEIVGHKYQEEPK